MTNLLLVRTVVTGKFVNKYDGDAFAGFLVVELDPIVRREMWHEFLVQKACARADNPASMVTTDPLV